VLRLTLIIPGWREVSNFRRKAGTKINYEMKQVSREGGGGGVGDFGVSMLMGNSIAICFRFRNTLGQMEGRVEMCYSYPEGGSGRGWGETTPQQPHGSSGRVCMLNDLKEKKACTT